VETQRVQYKRLARVVLDGHGQEPSVVVVQPNKRLDADRLQRLESVGFAWSAKHVHRRTNNSHGNNNHGRGDAGVADADGTFNAGATMNHHTGTAAKAGTNDDGNGVPGHDSHMIDVLGVAGNEFHGSPLHEIQHLLPQVQQEQQQEQNQNQQQRRHRLNEAHWEGKGMQEYKRHCLPCDPRIVVDLLHPLWFRPWRFPYLSWVLRARYSSRHVPTAHSVQE
jgi:hypothetical protein